MQENSWPQAAVVNVRKSAELLYSTAPAGARRAAPHRAASLESCSRWPRRPPAWGWRGPPEPSAILLARGSVRCEARFLAQSGDEKWSSNPGTIAPRLEPTREARPLPLWIGNKSWTGWENEAKRGSPLWRDCSVVKNPGREAVVISWLPPATS